MQSPSSMSIHKGINSKSLSNTGKMSKLGSHFRGIPPVREDLRIASPSTLNEKYPMVIQSTREVPTSYLPVATTLKEEIIAGTHRKRFEFDTIFENDRWEDGFNDTLDTLPWLGAGANKIDEWDDTGENDKMMKR